MLCYYNWNVWYKFLSSTGLKEFVHIFIMHQTSLWHLKGTIYRIQKRLRIAILQKGMTWKFIFPRRKINCVFGKQLWHRISFMISEKGFTRSMFLERVVNAMHQKSQQDIKKVAYQNFQFFQAINYLHVD